eukprot:gnl/MRDRNA2_/MRDRNA2_98968_c0_seq1.p1 gnl/MRDRNA2_/MRDRNA2_98968_c0~~gnl/MRDRNA2_/MRDRNA2_98968_c0_seq1.p1  ORF type:complete len:267 (+),score=55.52 gnl/MRDRNA2_/MRDRNA2_98968_c0_seq1:1025-1825(+)
MAIIQRFDTGLFALPGGMVEPGDDVATTITKEFIEEAMGDRQADAGAAAEKLAATPAGKIKILTNMKKAFVRTLMGPTGHPFVVKYDLLEPATQRQYLENPARVEGSMKSVVLNAHRAVSAYVAFMAANDGFIKLLKSCSREAQRHHTVYQGMVDDPRNTDNAWMETQAVWLHCNSCAHAEDVDIDEICANAALTPATDATKATWKAVDTIGELYASHRYMVTDILEELTKVQKAYDDGQKKRKAADKRAAGGGRGGKLANGGGSE